MTTTRDRMTEIIWSKLGGNNIEQASRIADDITAELLVRVKPLEWEETHSERLLISKCGAYSIYFTGSYARTALSFGVRETTLGWFDMDAIGDLAKAAANAHHRDTIMTALGLNMRADEGDAD